MLNVIKSFFFFLLVALCWPALAKTTSHQKYFPPISQKYDIPTPEYIVQASGKVTPHQQAQHIIRTVVREAKKNKISPEVIFRIIEIESHYRVRAVSPSGAVGLMQVLPQAHPEKVRGKAVFDIDTNIKIGIQIFLEIQARQMTGLQGTLQFYAGAPKGKKYSKKYAAVKWAYNPQSKYLVGAIPKSYVESEFFASLDLRRPRVLSQPALPQMLISAIALNGRY
jgi:soluble lytic murein transglycosylase-like protein